MMWRAVESIYQYDDELIIDQNGNIIGKWEDQHEDNQVEDEHSPEESIWVENNNIKIIYFSSDGWII